MSGAQQMAAQGRNGDSLMAHMSPGEIAIPPQVQTRQLLDAIRQAFAHFGIDINQFTAGSPASSRNPATGAPQYNFLDGLMNELVSGPGFAPGLSAMTQKGSNNLGGYLGMNQPTPPGGTLGNIAGGGIPAQVASAAAIPRELGQLQNPPSSAVTPSPGPSLSPLNRNFGQLLGSGQGTTPSFQGYNPYATATGGGPFNFYPLGTP